MASLSPIKSPLRYPGGKSKGLKEILPRIPENFAEFREPMVGGGSVFFALKQKYPKRNYWINDKNKDLYLFWKFCKENPGGLVAEIRKLKKEHGGGKKFYTYLISFADDFSELQRAARFFVLNRISFSGLVESGGYSDLAYHTRFTKSSIKRIHRASKILKRVKITNYDYSAVVQEPGENVFIFLDPPYYSKMQSKLYGKNGELHTKFDHDKFVKDVCACKHKWLITYDNCAKVNKLFASDDSATWKKLGWELQYGTNNLKEEKKAKIGKELFIFNYTSC